MAQIEEEVQIRVFALQHVPAQRQFDTAVADLAEVLLGARESDMRRFGNVHHQIVGRVVVDVDAAVEAVAPQSEIEAEIAFETAFPFQTGVDHRDGHGADSAVVLERGAVLVGQLRLIRAESGVADVTHAHAQFEQRDGAPFEEPFLVKVPAEPQRSEGGVLVVGAEFRGALVTEREIDEIAVVPDVVGVDVESEHTRTVFAAARAAFGVSRRPSRDVRVCPKGCPAPRKSGFLNGSIRC